MQTCPVCKGSGRLPVTQEPKAESDGEETMGNCPTCNGKGNLEGNQNQTGHRLTNQVTDKSKYLGIVDQILKIHKYPINQIITMFGVLSSPSWRIEFQTRSIFTDGWAQETRPKANLQLL